MSYTQDASIGVPFIHSFTKNEYKSGLHNWKIDQDKRGIMYFANDGGLLVYNGSYWNTYSTPNRTTFRSIAIDKNGIVYGGGQNEFGYFLPDDKGLWIYHSLRNKIPKKYKDFEDVWEILYLNNTIYFRSSGRLYQYRDDSFKVFDSLNIDFSCITNNELFVHDKSKGLYQLQGEQYLPVSGSDLLKGKKVQGIVGLRQGYLIATRNNGIYLLNRNELIQWECEDKNMLIDNEIRSLISLDNGNVAIGTVYGGLLVMDENGKTTQKLNKENGLLSNSVLSMFLDKDKNLWLGLDKGINHLQINSAFTRIFPDGSLEGAGYAAQVHDGQLYLGTNNGLYTTPWKKERQPLNSSSFSLVQNTKGQTWGLDVINNKLILSHNEGAFYVSKNSATKFRNDQGYWLFKKLNNDSQNTIAGTYQGLSLFKDKNGELEFIEKISDLAESSRFVEEDKYDNLWVGHPYKGIYKIPKSIDFINSPMELLGKERRLPSSIHNHLFKIKDEIIFCAELGTYTYNYENNQFVPNSKFNEIFGEYTKIRRLVETPNGDIWFITNDEIGLLEINDLGLDKKITKKIFPELKHLLNGGFELIYPYSDEDVFISTEMGFIHYSPKKSMNTNADFQVILNEVAITNNTKEIVFYGNALEGDNIQSKSSIIHSYPHLTNAFTFNYSATSYAQNKFLKYRYKLKGFNDDWSSWSSQNNKEYTNLPSGDYTFQIQAKNYQNIESEILEYSFNINPPWYLTIWAYLFYLISLLILIFIISRLVNRKYQHLEEDHEKIVQKNQAVISQLKSEKMELELEHKKRALVSSTLLLVQKNETLAEIKEDLTLIKKEIQDKTAKPKLTKLIHKLQQDEVLDEGWEQFMLHFNQLHGDFLQRLKKSYPLLTPKDLKLCGYLRMNLSTKEIASLLNISTRGVEASRYRLRKKVHLDSNENLTEFLMGF